MSDFFDQDTGSEGNGDGGAGGARPESGPAIMVNGSYQALEEGANFLQSVKNVANQAGFGKFRVYLNGTEIRPSSAPDVIADDMNVEVRPYDEAGYCLQ